MANQTFNLQVQEHPEYGELGVISPQLKDYFDPTTGMILAHDILEHITPHENSYVGEFLALGAFIYVRVEQGFYTRGYDFKTLGYEIQNLLQSHYWQDGEQIPDCSVVFEEDLYQEEIFKAVEEGVKQFVEEGEIEDQNLIPSATQITNWILLGYDKAVWHYSEQKIDAYTLCHEVFKQIQAQVDQWLKGAEEGDQATLTVDFDEYKVTLDEYYWWEGEEE
jgi:hypothetical protein